MTDSSARLLKRDQTADLLKGLAVILMIQVHIMEQFATPDTYNSMAGRVSLFLGGPFCAPVFMAVMGYFLAASRRSSSYYFKRGLLLFLGGILLNITRSANLLVRVVSGNMEADPWFYIFGVDILPLAGLTLWLLMLLRPVFRGNGLLYLAAAVFIATCSPFLVAGTEGNGWIDYGRAFFTGSAGWSYFPLFPWAAYVLAGYGFRLVSIQFPSLLNYLTGHLLVWIIPAGIVLLVTSPYMASVTHRLEGTDGYYHHGIAVFAWMMLFMTVYVPVIRHISFAYGSQALFRLIAWTGRKVTLLYVIQWLIIGNLATLVFRTQDLFEVTGWTIVVTVVTLVTGSLGRFKQMVRKIFQ